MPQIDRHKNRTVNIEFTAAEDFSILPYPERLTLILITSGSMNGTLNERPISIFAPGVLCLVENDNLKVIEKHNVAAQSFILGMEVQAQSDARWVCRIKKYLIQILGLLEDLHQNSEQSPVDSVLEYIHTNYSRKISLEDLTNCAHLNRVTLNKQFQERCGKTAMGYLFSHRLKVACDLLTHTGMKLDEIARATGFEYDTYFIRQFKAKKGISPT